MSDTDLNVNINVDAKPARQLIQKISNAVGTWYEPHQIVRLAEANAAVRVIDAEADREVEALRERAKQRMVAEETRKQQNIEAVAAAAIPLLGPGARPDEIDVDWMANLFDKCRIVSNEEMQALWARVLAGEANAPGTYSKRSINLLSMMDQSDAAIFLILCRFVVELQGNLEVLVFNHKDAIYAEAGLEFSDLEHLEAIGLISFDVVMNYGFFSRD